MPNGYRVTAREYLLLAAMFSIEMVPRWIPEEIKPNNAQDIIEGMEKKGLMLRIDGQFLPVPEIAYIFYSVSVADKVIWLDNHALAFVSNELTVLFEKADPGGMSLRMMLFEREEECYTYLSDVGYSEKIEEQLLQRSLPKAIGLDVQSVFEEGGTLEQRQTNS